MLNRYEWLPYDPVIELVFNIDRIFALIELEEILSQVSHRDSNLQLGKYFGVVPAHLKGIAPTAHYYGDSFYGLYFTARLTPPTSV